MFSKVSSAARGALGRPKIAGNGGGDRLRIIIDALPDLAWAQTPDGTVAYANGRFATFTGLPQVGALMSEVWPRVVSPAEITALTLAINACLRSNRVYEGVHKLHPARGGDSRMHLVRAVPFEGGDEPSCLVTAADVHDDVQTERLVDILPRAPEPPAALAGSGPAPAPASTPAKAAAFAAELERVDVPRIVLSSDGLLLSMNGAACDALEVDEVEAFVGGAWLDAWTGADRDAAGLALATARDGDSATFVGYLPTLAGRPKWWDVVVGPVPGQADRLAITLRETERPEPAAAPAPTGATLAAFGEWKPPESASDSSPVEATAMLADSPEVRAAFETAALVDEFPTMLWTTDATGAFDFVNARWTAYTAMSAEETRGRSWSAVVHPDDATALGAAWHEAVAERRSIEHEVRLRRASDDGYRWFAIHGVPKLDESGALLRWHGTANDVDDRRRAAESLAFLATANDTVSVSMDLPATLRAMADAAVPALADGCVIFLGDGRERIDPATVAHVDAGTAKALAEVYSRYPVGPEDAIAEVIVSGVARIDAMISGTHLATTARNAEHYRLLRELGTRSQMILPLVGGDRPFGAMLILSTTAKRHFSDADLAIARLFAKRAAVSVENVQLYASGRRAAEAMRGAFETGALPHVPGLSFDGAQRAGQTNDPPTTWYDVFRLPDGKLGITIGDVASPSIAGAVAAMHLRLSLRATALTDPQPARMLAASEALLALDESTRSAVPRAFVGIFDPTLRRLRYASVGISAPLLRRADGRVSDLAGTPLAGGDGLSETHDALIEEGATVVIATPALFAAADDPVKAARRLRRTLEDRTDDQRDALAAHLLDAVLPPGSTAEAALLTLHCRPRSRGRERAAPGRLGA